MNMMRGKMFNNYENEHMYLFCNRDKVSSKTFILFKLLFFIQTFCIGHHNLRQQCINNFNKERKKDTGR